MDSPDNDITNRRPTLSQVASLAGVSEITASRALRGSAFVAKGTRERILMAARQLNYVPNRLAGTLAGGASQQVGVILPSLSNTVFADVLKGLETRLEVDGFHPLLGISHYEPEREEHLLRDLLAWRPAGVVLAPTSKTPATKSLLQTANMPVVEVMDLDTAAADMTVGFSHRAAGRAMAHFLVGRGYRNFGYVGHDISADLRALARLEGFREGLADIGITLASVQIISEPSSVPLGRHGLEILLREAETRPEAIFFSNDDMAVGGVFHCLAEGLLVPDDIALAGFNGLSIGQALPQPLTTIASNREKIGFTAADLIVQRLQGKTPEKVQKIDFKLVPGGTA